MAKLLGENPQNPHGKSENSATGPRPKVKRSLGGHKFCFANSFSMPFSECSGKTTHNAVQRCVCLTLRREMIYTLRGDKKKKGERCKKNGENGKRKWKVENSGSGKLDNLNMRSFS